MKRNTANGGVVESKIPLDIKFSVIYDESIEDIEDYEQEFKGSQKHTNSQLVPEDSF